MAAAPPSPEIVFQTFAAYQRSAALKAAIDLDVFTAIGEGAVTPAALATHVGAAERGVRSLCDALVVLGFLTKADGRYGLGPDASIFLDRRSPAYVGTIGRFLTSRWIVECFEHLTEAVRHGGTAVAEQGLLGVADHPVWVEFARGMAPLARLTAEVLAAVLAVDQVPPRRVLDIAAGHGLFGITLAKHAAHAEVVALDARDVLAVARENAAAAGVEARFRTIEGSAFTADWGTGYDLVLLTNFLHGFDPATCEMLLAKARQVLVPGGRAVAVEFVPEEDRVSPPDAALFSLTMLATTAGGDAYTFAELEAMYRRVGFATVELRALPPSPQQAVIGRA
jgi:ubiquinone/menaquinone biosynthesis C-methylase UbiE